MVSGGVYAGATSDDVARLDLFGRKAGLAFQIVDDVLDMTVDSAQLGKTAGKDQATEKATWPAVFGLDQAGATPRTHRRSLRCVGTLTADRADGLKPIARYWSSGRTERCSLKPKSLTALRDCFDPEVKLNLVDLGLIYAVTTGPIRIQRPPGLANGSKSP